MTQFENTNTVANTTNMTSTNTTDYCPTDKELHNITLDAIRWEVRKATFMLLDVDSYFYLKPDQTYPDGETMDKVHLNFQRISAELDILNGILGNIFKLAEHDDDEDDDD